MEHARKLPLLLLVHTIALTRLTQISHILHCWMYNIHDAEEDCNIMANSHITKYLYFSITWQKEKRKKKITNYLLKSCTLIYEKVWVKIFSTRIGGTWNPNNDKHFSAFEGRKQTMSQEFFWREGSCIQNFL